MGSEIFLTGIFILVLVVTATAKTALDELSDVSLRLLVTEHDETPRARFWRAIRESYQQFRFTLTFGIHISIASIAVLISSLANRLYPAHFLALALGGMIVTVVAFRQILPLLITQNNPAGALYSLRWPLRLLRSTLGLVSDPLYNALRAFRRERDEETEDANEPEEEPDTENELQALLDVGEEAGIIEEDEGEMIQSIIRLSDRHVAEVMTPRTSLVAVRSDATLTAVRDLMIESKYSRLPVYHAELDDVEGVIYVRDLLKHWADGEMHLTAIDIARRPYEVPESKPISQLIGDMRKAKVQMAIVINEYGSVAGVVTLEDLIEEIVGEIEDEDEPEPLADDVDIVAQEDGSYLVRGSVEIGKIERCLAVELADDDFTTIAGLVINELNHLPTVSESIQFRGLKFEVVEADERRVLRLRIERVAPITEPAEAATAVTAESVKGETSNA